ncbi:MAG: phage major capsid protein [Pseudomonadota bacterium]
MSKIKELREEAKRLETEARSKLDAAGAEKDAEKAAALEAEFDSLMDQRDKLVKQAERIERSDEAKREREEIEERADREDRNARRPGAASDTFTAENVLSDEYREHFREFLAAGGDMSSLSSEARDALRKGFIKAEARTQTSTTGATGGYTVPTTLASFIEVAAKAHGPMWDNDVATVIQTSSGETITIPGVDDTDSETAAHTQGNEPADDDSGDVTITKDDLGAFSHATPWIKWAFELAQDSSFSWEQLLGDLIGERVGRTANKLLTTGTGTAQPLGFVPAAGVGHTAAAVGAITFDEIIELEHSVDPAYRGGPKVAFQMHDDTVKLLRKLKDSNGRYIWSDGDVTRGVPASLNGKTVRFNQAMATAAANAKTIAFGDFSKYYVRKVGAVTVGVAREKFFPNLGMAGVFRFDGAAGNLAGSAIKVLQQAAS